MEPAVQPGPHQLQLHYRYINYYCEHNYFEEHCRAVPLALNRSIGDIQCLRCALFVRKVELVQYRLIQTLQDAADHDCRKQFFCIREARSVSE